MEKDIRSNRGKHIKRKYLHGIFWCTNITGEM